MMLATVQDKHVPKTIWSSLSQPGGSKPNEDRFLAATNRFAVLDGATNVSHAKPLIMGMEPAEYAAHHFQQGLMDTNMCLDNLLLKLNHSLDKVIKQYIPNPAVIERFSTAAAVIDINEGFLEYRTIADCYFVLIMKDGNIQTPYPFQSINQDRENLLKLKSIRASFKGLDKDFDPFSELHQDLKVLRGMVNRTYGAFNGMPQAMSFVKRGKLPIDNVKSILLFTDGMLLPQEDPAAEPDFEKIAWMYKHGGLGFWYGKVRSEEGSDPYFLKYPAVKRHDDATALAIDFF